MLTTFQIEHLCTIAYLDVLIGVYNKHDLAYMMNHMLKEGFAALESSGGLPVLMTRAEWEQTAHGVAADKELGGLFVVRYADEPNGHRALCFMNRDDSAEAYVIFRGTSGDDEWLDNGLGMTEAETPAQKASLKFVNEVRASIKSIKYLCAAGHSKGGNKAQYCAVLGGGLVDACVSVDGQGFSKQFHEKYADLIKKGSGKITAIAERRDFVNCLGYYLKVPMYYSGRRGDKTAEQPNGQPLQFFHCPDALRDNSGNPGESAQRGYISQAINAFITYFLSEEKYAHKHEKTARGLVSLMTDNINMAEAVSAIADAALVFFELAEKSGEFRGLLRDVITNEHNVIAATVNMLKGNKHELTEKAFKLTAEKLILKPAYFRDFIKVSERYAVFVNEAKKHKERYSHLKYFVGIIMRHIDAKGKA